MAPKPVKQLEQELPPVALTATGSEIPDPTPLEIPAGFKIPETAEQRFQRMVRHSMSEWAKSHEAETFDEADDFEVEDEYDPTSRYETAFDPVLGRDISPQEFRDREHHLRSVYLENQKRYWQESDRLDALRTRPRARSERGAGGGQPPASTPPVQPSKGETDPT